MITNDEYILGIISQRYKKVPRGKKMKKNKVSMPLTVIASTLLSVFASYSAVAEGTSNSKIDSNVGEVITVTSSRRVQALQDVPAAIVAINPEEFSVAGLTAVSDLVEYTPGFSLTRGTGQRGQGAITARGVSQVGATAVVSVYVDDIPMTSNSGFAGGSGLFFDGLLGDIERIEMIKGPQGTLFGATAVGGAMRYITKKPTTDEMRGGTNVNLSSTEHGGFNQTYSGFVSLPLIDETLGITVSGFYDDNGGLIDRVTPGTTDVIKEDADSSQNKGFSADLLYTPTDNTELRLRALHQESEFNGNAIVRITGEDKTPTYSYFVGDDQLSNNAFENTFISGSLDYYFDDMTLTASSSHIKYEKESYEDVTQAYSGLADLLQGNVPGTTTAVGFANTISSEKNVHELRLTSDNSDTFEWLAGIYYAEESTTNTQLGDTQPNPFILFQAAFPSEYKESAVFANVTYYFNENFDVTAGMRYADTSMTLNFITDGPLAGGAANLSLPDAEGEIKTYLLAARYRVDDDMSIYSRIASGYRPASANLPVYDPFTGVKLTQDIVDQDDLWSYEIGAKGNINNGFLHYDLSAWTLQWDNFQGEVIFNGVSSLGNAKDGITASGFEASFDADFDNGFTVLANVAYAESTLNSDEIELNGLKGASVPGVPKWTASARANYSFDLSSNIMANISAGLRYTDGTPSAFADGDSEDSLQNIVSDDYTLIDINAGIVMDDISVNLYVTNLFDKHAFAGINAYTIPTPGGVFFDAQAAPVTPRMVGVNLSYKF